MTRNTIKKIVTTDRLPKHDLFFGIPNDSPEHGLMLGDGDTGSLIWVTEDELHIIFNKTDLWDDAVNESPVFCSDEEENISCLRYGAELVVRLGSPGFHLFYQKAYTARLSLKDATVSLEAETPFSAFAMQAFASNASRTTVFACRYQAKAAEEVSLSLSRWGSRNFWRGHYQMLDAPEKGLDGTGAECDDNRILILQQLNGRAFCVGVQVVFEGQMIPEAKGDHESVIRLEKARELRFMLHCRVSVADTLAQAKADCVQALEASVACGWGSLLAAHCQSWREFWNRSYVAIPNDYVENLYYLSLYYSNSECRGAYPPHFTNGIWGFQKDYMPWSYYFHYNMQHMYAPLEAAGHGDLTEGFHRMRRDQLETAKRFASEVKKRKGAFYHDITDRFGRGARIDGENSSCGAQIAMAMWKHYRYSGDEVFLQEVALPVMEATAEYYCDLLEMGSDGFYHTHGTSAYEANPTCTDTVTDLAMMKALFGVLVRITTGEAQNRYADVLSHLTEPILVPLDEDDWDGSVFTYGRGKGKVPAEGNSVLAMGRNQNGEPVRKSFGNRNSTRSCYGFPDVELSLLYPSSVVGLADRGTPVFNALLNHLSIHGAAEACMNWCMMPIYLARMGRAEELAEYWNEYISCWQIYPNGLNADGPAATSSAYDLRSKNTIGEVKTHTVVEYPAYMFRHFDLESTPILAAAVNEMLLQSYDGIVRICPATPPKDEVAFSLYAQGGFRVHANVREKDYKVLVESLRGEALCIKLPERFDSHSVHLFRRGLGEAWRPASAEIHRQGCETVISFASTEAGEQLFFSNERGLPEIQLASIKTVRNAKMKKCGKACLGSVAVLH